MRRLTRVCTVCLCHINGTLGIIGLKLTSTEKGGKMNGKIASPESEPNHLYASSKCSNKMPSSAAFNRRAYDVCRGPSHERLEFS